MKKIFLLSLVFLFSVKFSLASELDPLHPKRDVRSVWFTYQEVEKYKLYLPQMLMAFKSAGINTVYFHTRAFSDAHYQSSYDPWAKAFGSSYPGYDPLQLMIDESHKLGLELHAWINPLRSHSGARLVKTDGVNTHVSESHPDWIMSFPSYDQFIVNPGIPEAREYVVNVIKDIVSRYDVDGIVYDDYFYPYPEGGVYLMKNSTDQTAYDNDPRGITNRSDWRRDNTRLLIKETYEAIEANNIAQNKSVIFGVSPFGVYRRGAQPISNPYSLDGYNDIYIDPVKWLQEGIIDYLSPQLYWSHTSGQEYDILADWWDNKCGTYGRYHYPSMFTSLNNTLTVPVSESVKQINTNRLITNEHTFGQVFYSASSLLNKNSDAIIPTLLTDLYKYPSVPPAMTWINDVAPNSPTNVSFDGNTISWDAPTATSEGIVARKYIVYAFDQGDDMSVQKNNGTKLIGVTGETSFDVDAAYSGKVLAVSALDAVNNESELATEGSLGVENDIVLVNSVYPNPVSDNGLTIKLNETNVNIDIVSIEGRLVYSEEARSNNITIDTQNWNKGMYLVMISTGNQKQVVKVIKE